MGLSCWLTVWKSCWLVHAKEFVSMSPRSANKVLGTEHSSSWIQEDLVISGSTWNYPLGSSAMTEQEQTTNSSRVTGKTAPLCAVWPHQTGKASRTGLLVLLYIYLGGDKKWEWGSEDNPSTAGERRGLRGQGCCKGGIDEVVVVTGRFGSAAVPKITVLSYLRWLPKQDIVSHIHQVLG